MYLVGVSDYGFKKTSVFISGGNTYSPARCCARSTGTMSTFGHSFRVTTYGESHCPSVGCIIDGCPPGMKLTAEDIQPQMTRRRPGQSALTTPRDEKDRIVIQSGTEFGVTLGTPICLIVKNEDQRPKDYGGSTMDTFPRPSHADYT